MADAPIKPLTDAPKMFKVTVDDKEVEIAAGSVVIQATKKAGQAVPHFCYHEGLTIVGQCRMCFVEIEGQKKLATACSTPVVDGMKIKTQSEVVKKGQNGTLEFILLNHPLDCPICDRGGECKLQDYTLEYGPPRSRMVDEKVLRDKHRPISKEIVLDQERCILCTRCTRFSSEIDGRAELVVNERGNASCIDVFDGKMLTSGFSGNVVDLCPVGALTAEDFRFEARPWELREHQAVCSGCSVGCNVYIDTKHRDPKIPRPDKKPPRPQIKRLMPRKNAGINEWWMCDKGRWGYHFHNDDAARIYEPLLQKASKSFEPVSLKEWQIELDVAGKEWEFWVDSSLPHEGIAWAKDLQKSWTERGRKVAINPSDFGSKFLKIWAKFINASPWGIVAADWSNIKEVVATKPYRDLESVVPILSLKLGQRLRHGKIKWTVTSVAEFSSLEASPDRAFLFDIPQTDAELAALDKIAPTAKVLVLWTQVNSRGLVNEGIAPPELLAGTAAKASAANVFLFTQKTQNAMAPVLLAKLQSAKKLFVAASFIDESWSTKAVGILPLTPLYESNATLTSVEGYQQVSHGIRIDHPNTPSIHRGSDSMVSPALMLI